MDKPALSRWSRRARTTAELILSRVETLGTQEHYEAFPLTMQLTIVNGDMLTFTRRLGPDPHANGAKTSSAQGCPDILELSDGDFAIIGPDITVEAEPHLKFGAGRSPEERIIRIPRKTLILAKPDIPDHA